MMMMTMMVKRYSVTRVFLVTLFSHSIESEFKWEEDD